MKKNYFVIILIILLAAPFVIYSQTATKVFEVDSSKCIGCTICVRSGKCPTNAIEMKSGKAVIDASKCIDCGICAKQCPFAAIHEVEFADSTAQMNEEKVHEVADSTEIAQQIYMVDADACIGCKICVRKCPVSAITMKDGKAVIHSTKCISCGICADKCPVKAIYINDEEK